jgi:hypothetical protein
MIFGEIYRRRETIQLARTSLYFGSTLSVSRLFSGLCLIAGAACAGLDCISFWRSEGRLNLGIAEVHLRT